MRSLIFSMCFTAVSCVAQHPYFQTPISDIDGVYRADGYRSVASIEGDCIVYHLYSSTDTVILVYKSGMTLPVYIIYKEQ